MLVSFFWSGIVMIIECKVFDGICFVKCENIVFIRVIRWMLYMIM